MLRKGTLIAGGESYDVPFEIRNWLDHGMRFTWSKGGVRRRRNEPNLLVPHWTAAENGERAIFRNLGRRRTKDGRGLSIHGFIDYYGIFWQYADLAHVCRHASAVNGRSVGVEIQNMAVPRKTIPRSWRKFKRPVRRMMLKGRSVRVCLFTADQMDTWNSFADQVCDIFGIPKHIPGDPELLDQGTNASGLVLADRIPKKRWRNFRGVVGHYMVSRKICPGIQPLETLVEDGFELVKVA